MLSRVVVLKPLEFSGVSLPMGTPLELNFRPGQKERLIQQKVIQDATIVIPEPIEPALESHFGE